MTKLPHVARVLMGLVFVGAGIAGLMSAGQMPPDLPQALQTFMTGILAAKYFFPLLKGTEILCGLLLLSNRFVPLALVILAPVILNIFCVHLFLAPSGLPMALVLGALEIYLAFFAKPYSERLCPLFVAKS
jgi:putative oxidoreductase